MADQHTYGPGIPYQVHQTHAPAESAPESKGCSVGSQAIFDESDMIAYLPSTCPSTVITNGS
jgi:hypothetical protein